MRCVTIGACLAGGIVVVSAASCFSQDAEEVARVLAETREEVAAPGAIVAIRDANGNETVVVSGYADQATGRAMKPGMPYYLGSVSKTYTAAVILRLAEEGRLSLADPLTRYIPELTVADGVTIEQLLNHTSGLKDFYSYLYFRPDRAEMIDLVTRSWTQAEVVGLINRFGQWFPAGTDWTYSSTNYYLLGMVIERVTSMALPEAYRHYVYHPLELESTWLAWHEDAKAPLPTGYLGSVASWPHSAMFGDLGSTTELERSPIEWGAGGLAATASDAATFLQGIMTGRLLTAASRDAMTRFRPTPSLGVIDENDVGPDGDGYGLGLVSMVRRGLQLIGHGGLFTGHTAGLWYVPACRTTIALYFNRGFINQRVVIDRLLTVIAARSALAGCRVMA
jgi:D-alanyl-D-alanine carboxypeptidase